MTPPRASASMVAVIVLALTVAACSTGSRPPSAPIVTAAAPSPAASDAPDETLDPSLPSKSETDWGPIWDAVPANFPVIDGAEPAEAPDPVSAAYTVPAAAMAPREIAEVYQTGFAARSLGGGVDGPLEDGSFTSWGSNGYGCDVLVTVVPRGDERLVTVLYGAGCEFEWPAPEG